MSKSYWEWYNDKQAKQAKQDEEEYRRFYVEVMTRRMKGPSKCKFIDDERAKMLEGKILEQAEIDAKQAKQVEAAKEEFRLKYVAFMARTNADTRPKA
jgi:hypothetical protein